MLNGVCMHTVCSSVQSDARSYRTVLSKMRCTSKMPGRSSYYWHAQIIDTRHSIALGMLWNYCFVSIGANVSVLVLEECHNVAVTLYRLGEVTYID